MKKISYLYCPIDGTREEKKVWTIKRFKYFFLIAMLPLALYAIRTYNVWNLDVIDIIVSVLIYFFVGFIVLPIWYSYLYMDMDDDTGHFFVWCIVLLALIAFYNFSIIDGLIGIFNENHSIPFMFSFINQVRTNLAVDTPGITSLFLVSIAVGYVILLGIEKYLEHKQIKKKKIQ